MYVPRKSTFIVSYIKCVTVRTKWICRTLQTKRMSSHLTSSLLILSSVPMAGIRYPNGEEFECIGLRGNILKCNCHRMTFRSCRLFNCSAVLNCRTITRTQNGLWTLRLLWWFRYNCCNLSTIHWKLFFRLEMLAASWASRSTPHRPLELEKSIFNLASMVYVRWIGLHLIFARTTQATLCFNLSIYNENTCHGSWKRKSVANRKLLAKRKKELTDSDEWRGIVGESKQWSDTSCWWNDEIWRRECRVAVFTVHQDQTKPEVNHALRRQHNLSHNKKH